MDWLYRPATNRSSPLTTTPPPAENTQTAMVEPTVTPSPPLDETELEIPSRTFAFDHGVGSTPLISENPQRDDAMRNLRNRQKIQRPQRFMIFNATRPHQTQERVDCSERSPCSRRTGTERLAQHSTLGHGPNTPQDISS